MQLITTKFFISPPPADYVPRPQLLKKLVRVSTYKLTILSAPAGFGKTTLLSAWLRDAMDKTANHDGNSIKIQPCWLSLDTEDNEPGHFLEVLFATLEDSGIQLDAAAAFLPIKGSVNYRSALDALVHDLSNSLNEIVLALDDYHVIENKEVHGLIHHLISRAPQSFHVLISTRSHPPLETGKLRASGQLLELGQADLKFTLEETREYLHHVQGLALVEKDIVAIASKTEGWISGLKMAVLSMQNSEDPAAFVKALNGSHRYIFDYLMEQALAQQPPDVKEFLLKTSIVESFNASLCDALIQDEKYPPGASQKILTYLEQANLFIIPLDDERQWFRYHHLFGELLQSVLRQTSPEKIASLQHHACDWYESNNMIPDAVNLAIAAGDIERAARMISSNVLLLVEQTELKTILRRLDVLFSSGQIAENPWLHVAYAWVLVFSGETKRAENILQKIKISASALTDLRDRNELHGNLLAAQAYIQWVVGHHDKGVELGRQAAEYLSTSNTAVRALNLTTLARILVNLDQYEEALQFAQQAVDIGNAIGQPNIVMLAITSLAYIYHNIGQIEKSSEICEQALEQADAYRRKNGRILPSAVGAYVVQAHNFYSQYDMEKAYWYAKRALALSEIWDQAEELFSAGWIMARVLSARNEPEAALKVLKTPIQTSKLTSDWDLYLVKLLDGNIYFECGNMENTRKIVGELMELACRIPLDPANYYPHYELSIKVLIMEGEYEKALNKIDQWLDHFKDKKSEPETSVAFLLLRAWACQKLGDGKGTISALETALQSAEPTFNVRPFIGVFQYLEEPLRILAAKGTYKVFLDRVFAVQQGKTSSQPIVKNKSVHLNTEGLIEPLTERELEILRLLNSHLPTPEIADMLVVSVNTIRTHIKSIYAKLGVHSRSAAIDMSKRLKLPAQVSRDWNLPSAGL